MLKFNTNLFRIASMCQSRDKTRFYLAGVYIEPHPVAGVTLTATDGHQLVCIHDADGEATESAIISLKDIVKRPTRSGVVLIDTGDSKATLMQESIPVAMEYDVRVDGSFPDYRAILKSITSGESDDAPVLAATFVANMASIGIELAKHFTDWSSRYNSMISERKDGMRMSVSKVREPIIIRWQCFDQAFGVVMPMRGDVPSGLPDWVFPPEKKKKAVA